MRHISLLKTIICMLLIVDSQGAFAAATSLCTGGIRGRTVSASPIGFETSIHSYRCAGGAAPPCTSFEFDPVPGMSLNPLVLDPHGGVHAILINYRFTFQNITSIPQTVDVSKSVVNGYWGGNAWGGAAVPSGGTMANATLATSGVCNRVRWARGNLTANGPVETGCVASLGPNESILGSIDVILCGNGSISYVVPGSNPIAACNATRARTLSAWTIFNLNINACADRGAITGALSLASSSYGGMGKENRYPPSVTPINGGRPF